MQAHDTSRTNLQRRTRHWLWLGTLLVVVLAEWGVHSIRGKGDIVPAEWRPTSWATSGLFRTLSTSHDSEWVQLKLELGHASASREGASIEAIACRVRDRWYELPGISEAGVWSTRDTVTVERLGRVQCLAKVGAGVDQRIAYVARPATAAAAIETVQLLLLFAFLLSVPVAYAVLISFRRRVMKGLREPGGREPLAELGFRNPSAPGRLDLLKKIGHAEAPSDLLKEAKRLGRRLSSIWLALAAIVALLSAWMYAPEGAVVHHFGDVVQLWFFYTGPIALPLLGLVALHRRCLALVCGGYFAMLVVTGTVFGPELGIVDRISGLIFPAFGCAAGLVLAHRRVRAFVPVIILAALLVLGAQLPLVLLAHSPAAVTWFSSVAAWLGFTEAFGPLTLASLVVVAAAGWVSWTLLRALGRRYHAARLSDRVLVGMMVTLSTILLYTVATSEPAVSAAFLPVIALVFVGARSAADASPRPRILFLRVFARGTIVADRLDELCRQLLNVARVDMIAGPDLASAVVQPGELLDFLVGKFGRGYIHNLQEFAARVEAIDARPDLEGRQRVRDFYCTNAVWKDVFNELARTAQLVIIDLSQFTRQRSGTAFELEALVHSYPLERVIAIVDESTDRGAVADVLDQAWSSLPTDSPNQSRQALLSVLEVKGDNPKSLRSLLGAACRIISTKRF